MTQTFSLEEVAAGLRLHTEMKDPVRWLTRQIRTGKITARRLGRSWRMTQADIDEALEAFANGRRARVTEPTPIGLSAASMRRRAS